MGRKILTSTTASNTENGVDGDDLDTEPGLEHSGSLLGSVGSSGHGGWSEWGGKGGGLKREEKERKKKKRVPVGLYIVGCGDRMESENGERRKSKDRQEDWKDRFFFRHGRGPGTKKALCPRRQRGKYFGERDKGQFQVATLRRSLRPNWSCSGPRRIRRVVSGCWVGVLFQELRACGSGLWPGADWSFTDSGGVRLRRIEGCAEARPWY